MVDAGAGEGEALLASPLSYGESYFEILLAGILGFLAVSLGGLGVLRVLRIQPAKE
jgi:hypothetical protein